MSIFLVLANRCFDRRCNQIFIRDGAHRPRKTSSYCYVPKIPHFNSRFIRSILFTFEETDLCYTHILSRTHQHFQIATTEEESVSKHNEFETNQRRHTICLI